MYISYNNKSENMNQMEPRLVKAVTMFVTDRDQFHAEYSNNVELSALCHEVFMKSESRPQLAEHIAISKMGHIVCHEKKYDGMIFNNGQFVRYSEYKVTCRRTGVDGDVGKMTSIQINDVTRSIVDWYIQDQPLFVFPYFIDGHLAAMFSVDFAVLHPTYEKFLATNEKKGRPSFSLPLGVWINEATVEFIHKNTELIKQLPPMMQTKIYQSHPDYQRNNSMTGTVKFPAGHKFERYGYNFDTDRVVSYIRVPTGQDRSEKSGIKVAGYGYAAWQEFKAEAEILLGLPVTVTKTTRAAKPLAGIYVHTAQPAQQPKKMFVTFTQEITADMTIADILRQFNANTAKMEIVTA